MSSRVQLSPSDVLLVTGATGLVGSHVVEQATQRGLRVRALVRPGADSSLLTDWGAELAFGDLDAADSLAAACQGVSVVVHCAAKVGDWGPIDEYRRINVEGTRALLVAALASGSLRRWIQISSLGVYPATDHYGTDESTPLSTKGIDGYTLTKAESEQLVAEFIRDRGLPGVILRPGFLYGSRDRTVLPRLLDRLRAGKFAYLGSPERLMNNTWVGNLCTAIWLAIESDEVVGQTFNIRDPRAVTKREFVETVCDASGLSHPKKVVPLPIAEALASAMEFTWKLLRKSQAPLLNQARIKFLGRNLDFSIDKAGRELGYHPVTDFREAMTQSLAAAGR